jgi:hypothetical protein
MAARGETKRLEILLSAADVEAVLAVADLTGHATLTEHHATNPGCQYYF